MVPQIKTVSIDKSLNIVETNKTLGSAETIRKIPFQQRVKFLTENRKKGNKCRDFRWLRTHNGRLHRPPLQGLIVLRGAYKVAGKVLSFFMFFLLEKLDGF